MRVITKVMYYRHEILPPKTVPSFIDEPFGQPCNNLVDKLQPKGFLTYKQNPL